MTDVSNPFFSPSSLPYRLPPFGDITDADYAPALRAGLEQHLLEVSAITANTDAPTFENTIVALDRAGVLLGRVARVFFNKASSDSDPVTDAVEEEFAPLLAAHDDAIKLDADLFAKVDAVYAQRSDLDLDPESLYLLERTWAGFTHAGAGLPAEDKVRLSELNLALATLTNRFEKNLLADTNDLAVVIDDVAQLDGLAPGEIAAAAEAAGARGLEGKYLIQLVLFSGHPYLASLTDRSVRERIMRASLARGSRGGQWDNSTIVLEITRLRAERAALLGFASHAAYVTSDETARTPDAVHSMLSRLALPAARNARAEKARLQTIADELQDAAGGERFEIESWDWAFYTEKVRSAEYDIDTSVMRPYFELERVLHDGVFHAARLLYGVTITERPDLLGYHPEARVFEVTDEDGTGVGLFVGDFYTRDSKRGGAWMNSLVEQSTLLDSPVVVVNNLNIPKPPAGTATLLTLDEVTTLFHEFGHALHGLFARVTYPSFSGTNVYRDFVEFPSQVNEMWILWPEVLSNYAKHVDTGEPLPEDLVDRLRLSSTFNEGFATSEYLAASILDQAWHSIAPGEEITDVAAFERNALEAAGLWDPAVPTRYSSTYFAHIFSGSYDAGYYSYIWSEVLDADTVTWFEENGGLTRENGDRFRARLLGQGGSKNALEAYRDFRGRDAVIEPLLKRRGLSD